MTTRNHSPKFLLLVAPAALLLSGCGQTSATNPVEPSGHTVSASTQALEVARMAATSLGTGLKNVEAVTGSYPDTGKVAALSKNLPDGAALTQYRVNADGTAAEACVTLRDAYAIYGTEPGRILSSGIAEDGDVETACRQGSLTASTGEQGEAVRPAEPDSALGSAAGTAADSVR